MMQQQQQQEQSQQTESVNSQKVENLLSWLTDCGATGLDSIEVKPSPNCSGSLGCFTKIARQVGDVVAKIPRKCIFGLGEALKSPLTSKLQEFEKGQSKEGEKSEKASSTVLSNEFLFWIYLGQCLLETDSSEAQRCFWKPYLESLPSESPIVSNWDESLLTLISGTNLGGAVSAEQNRLADQTEFLESFCAANAGVLHADIVKAITWSKGNYLSRRFVGRLAIEGEGIGQEQYGGQIGCLVPFFDLLNHQNGFKVKFEMDATSVSYVCESALEIGDEIFNNYCTSSNEELMFTYGFTIPNNPSDSLPLKLVAASSKPTKKKNLKSKKSKQNAPVELSAPKSLGLFHVRKTLQGGIPKSLFAQLIGTDDIDDIYPEEIELVQRMITSKDSLITNAIAQLEEDMKNKEPNVQREYIQLYLNGQKAITNDAIVELNQMKADALGKHGLTYH